jgi:hypothetical protein
VNRSPLKLDEALRRAATRYAPAEPTPDRPPLDSRPALLAQARRMVRARIHRRMEGLRLYRPLPPAAAFHDSAKRIRILCGSNQSGKSLTAAAEVAMAVTGMAKHNFPVAGGNGLVVGQSEDHLGDPMYARLCLPGAFSIIRDEQTRRWRSVRPDPNDPLKLDPYDAAYREKWQDAPPLLPPRVIKGNPSWQDKSKGVPRKITLHNGWKLLWLPGGSKPKRGSQWHLWWFDEEIEDQSHLPEALRGCLRFGGKGFWSATPETGGVQLYELYERAEAGDRDVGAFPLYLEENPYYTDEEKEAFYNSLDEDQRAVKYFGKFALAGRRIYPMYEPMGVHGCEPFAIPETYTRYVILDPGRQHMGTIFAAVDPDEQYVYIYDGFDLRNADANRWAQRVKQRQGDTRFEAMVIDKRCGKTKPIAALETVAEHYWRALEEVGIRPRTPGPMYGFFPGSDDVSAREEALLDWMRIRGAGPHRGTARLKVFRGAIPDLDTQIKHAHYDLKRPDKRVELQEDVLDCLEYLAAFNPHYREPEPIEASQQDKLMAVWEAKQARLKRRRPDEGHVYG